MLADAHLGFRSRLVLEKLGFDLRPYLDETLRAPLPARLQRLADELGGYAEWRDIGPPAQPAPAAAPPASDEDWQWAVPYDQPFGFR